MLEELDIPYTYFETNTNLICYSYGKNAKYERDLLAGSVVGYFCNEKTDRMQFSTDKFVKKLIFEGNELTIRDELIQTLPDTIITTLVKNTKIYPETKEELFTIEYSNITKVYSPKNSLKKLLNGEAKASINQIKIAEKVVSLLTSHGVALDNIGIYGSLQADIVKNSGDNDVDIIVYGLDNYDKVQDLLNKQNKNQVAPVSKYKQFSQNEIWTSTSLNRRLNSKILLENLGTSDLRIIEKPNEIRSMSFQNLKFDSEIIEIEGIVIDSKESLTIPSIYSIETKNGIFKVGTRLYVFLGAAKKGDFVKAKGVKIKNSNALWIANQSNQYIFNTNQ